MEAKRSCVFCRTRKMKCSGAAPKCESCNVRELNCVYEHATRKSTLTSSNASRSGALGSSSSSSSTSFANKRSRKNNSVTPERTFAQALDETFKSLGSETQVSQDGSTSTQNDTSSALLFSNSLQAFTHDLVAGVVAQISSLPRSATPPSAFKQAYAADSSQSIFQERSLPTSNPSVNMPENLVIQVVQLSFCYHPILAAICSIGQLIDDVRARKADRSLLNLILSEGIALGVPKLDTESSPNMPSADLLAYDAERHLRSTGCSTEQDTTTSMPVLLLLAWRAFRLVQPKAAVAYLTVACMVVRWWIAEHKTSSRQEFTINGVLSSHLRQELMVNMFWICSSAQCWVSLQLSCRLPLAFGSRPVENTVPLPPLDVSESLIHELDRLSGWFSGLALHADITTQLRVLAHVECLVNHLNLLAGEMRAGSAQGSSCSQRFALEIPVILKESVSALPSNATTSQSDLLSTSYRCIALALSFPCTLASTPCTLDAPATETLIEVCSALTAQADKRGGSSDGAAKSLERIVGLTAKVACRLLVLVLGKACPGLAASHDELNALLELTSDAQMTVQSSLPKVRASLASFSSTLSAPESKNAQEDTNQSLELALQLLDSLCTQANQPRSESLQSDPVAATRASSSSAPAQLDIPMRYVDGVASASPDTECSSSSPSEGVPSQPSFAQSKCPYPSEWVSSPDSLHPLASPNGSLLPQFTQAEECALQYGQSNSSMGHHGTVIRAALKQNLRGRPSFHRSAAATGHKRVRVSEEECYEVASGLADSTLYGRGMETSGLSSQLPFVEGMFPLWRHQSSQDATYTPSFSSPLTFVQSTSTAEAKNTFVLSSTSSANERSAPQHTSVELQNASLWNDATSFDFPWPLPTDY